MEKERENVLIPLQMTFRFVHRENKQAPSLLDLFSLT